jgi:hypothetical protein
MAGQRCSGVESGWCSYILNMKRRLASIEVHPKSVTPSHGKSDPNSTRSTVQGDWHT